MPATQLIDADLVSRRVVVRNQDVVFVKGIFEASEGLGSLFAERGGELTISAPLSRSCELDELLLDLQREIQAEVSCPKGLPLAPRESSAPSRLGV